MAKKWSGIVVQRTFIKGHSFVYRLYVLANSSNLYTIRAPLLPAPDNKPRILGQKIEGFTLLVHRLSTTAYNGARMVHT